MKTRRDAKVYLEPADYVKEQRQQSDESFDIFDGTISDEEVSKPHSKLIKIQERNSQFDVEPDRFRAINTFVGIQTASLDQSSDTNEYHAPTIIKIASR